MATYNQKLADTYSDQLLLHVDRVAETSKSYLIEMIFAHLKEKAFQHDMGDFMLRAALIGVATFNIYSKTLYQLFHLLVQSKFYKLTEGMLFSLQSR